MPQNKGIEDFNDEGLSRTLAPEELSPRLLTHVGTQVSPLATRALIPVTMPPLAFYIWHQPDYFRQRGNQVAEWLALPQLVHLPTLLPTLISTQGRLTTLLPMRQRLLNLIWLRHRRKREGKHFQRVNVTDKEQLISGTDKGTWVNELYPNELLQALDATEEEQSVNAANEFYPMSMGDLLSQPVARMGLPGITQDFFRPSYAAPLYLPANHVMDDLTTKDTGSSTVRHTGQSNISSIYPVNQIQNPDRRRIEYFENALAQANWQPQYTYQSPWLDKIRAPLSQELVQYRLPMNKPPHIPIHNLGGIYTTPPPYLSQVMTAREGVEPSSQAAQQPILPYADNISNIVEATPPGEENQNLPVDFKTESDFPYFLPHQIKLTKPGIVSTRLGQPSTLKTRETSKQLWFNPPTVSTESALGLLTSKTILRQTSEISQAKQMAPLVNLLPLVDLMPSVPQVNPLLEPVGQGAEAMNIPEDLDSMTASQVTAILAPPDSISFDQGQQVSQAETPSIHREPLAATGALHQLSSISESIHQVPVLPIQRYFKLAGNDFPPDRSENASFLGKQDYETSATRYRDTNQLTSELLFTSAVGPAGPGTSTRATGSGESLSTESPTPSRTEAKTEETTREAATPDMDAIARVVYGKLKRRLARETEWA